MKNTESQESLLLIDNFKRKKILVIGDLIVDVFFSGSCTRISPEAPVPVVDVNCKRYCLGGAANVVANLKALGCYVGFCSVSGNDEGRRTALELLQQHAVDEVELVSDMERKTLVKTRISTDDQCLLRIDEGTTSKISAATEQKLMDNITRLYSTFDAILISDYNKGLFSVSIIRSLGELLKKNGKFLAIDSKNLKSFKELKPDLIKPNYKECIELLNLEAVSKQRTEQLKAYGKEIYQETNARISAVTLDKEGVIVFSGDKVKIHKTAPTTDVQQVSGAGDSFIAAFLLAYLTSKNLLVATNLALETAKIVIEKKETALCSSHELKSLISKECKFVAKPSSLKELADYYHAQGRKVVFTNGCFDILHRGHIEYLNQAKQLGDILIVGINNDMSIKRLKGPERPINNLIDRTEVLSALSCIDHVISFGSAEDDTPIDLIKIIRPHVFAKGGDYKGKDIPELEVLKDVGADVQFIPFVKNLSTSNIIKKISSKSPLKIVKTG